MPTKSIDPSLTGVWARLGGISLARINALERDTLLLLGFRLHVSEAEWDQWVKLYRAGKTPREVSHRPQQLMLAVLLRVSRAVGAVHTKATTPTTRAHNDNNNNNAEFTAKAHSTNVVAPGVRSSSSLSSLAGVRCDATTPQEPAHSPTVVGVNLSVPGQSQALGPYPTTPTTTTTAQHRQQQQPYHRQQHHAHAQRVSVPVSHPHHRLTPSCGGSAVGFAGASQSQPLLAVGEQRGGHGGGYRYSYGYIYPARPHVRVLQGNAPQHPGAHTTTTTNSAGVVPASTNNTTALVYSTTAQQHTGAVACHSTTPTPQSVTTFSPALTEGERAGPYGNSQGGVGLENGVPTPPTTRPSTPDDDGVCVLCAV